MSVKTITITEDAYNRLAARKTEGESFSEVIRKLTGRHSLLELAGILTESEAKKVEAAIREQRAAMRVRLDRIAKMLNDS